MAELGGEKLPELLRGRTGQEPRSNMVRVFISSCSSDSGSERRALLDRCFPELLTFCRSLGLTFEVVDLCWGVRGVLARDHQDPELFLQQVQTCRRVSAGPAFVALLGSRYGHRPLPRLLPENLFQTLLSKPSDAPEAARLLGGWYRRDDNAVPPAYVLRPIASRFPRYGDPRPENAAQHDKDVQSWRLTEAQMLRHLRGAAAEAEAAGDIPAEARRSLITSVMEQELDLGLGTDGGDASALLFLREAPRQKTRDGPRRLFKLMDVTAEGLLDAEARGLLAALKSRLQTSSREILNLHCVELSRGVVDPKRREHAQYLDAVCQQFVSQMKTRIQAALDAPDGGRRRIFGGVDDAEDSSRLEEEVRRHLAMSAERCDGVPGREGLLGKLCLAMWESTAAPHGPLVVHGAAGMGKTALLCRLARETRAALDADAAVVIRLLDARHPGLVDVDQLLHSVCLQICLASGVAPPSAAVASAHEELVGFFHGLLGEVSRRRAALLVILDGVDLLSDRHGAQKLRWLPAELPPGVHVVVSMETTSEAFVNMRLKLKTPESFFEVGRLTRDDGRRILESNLRARRRTLTPEQSEAALRSFDATGCPLHLALIISAAARWSSSDPLAQLRLGSSAKEMMSQLFLTLEEAHGRELVGGALGYIALSRCGLLEAELRDVLSLDNDVIAEVYSHYPPSTPSLVRLPPLLWARLRRDLDDHLEERWTCGVAAVAFKDRRLREAAARRYLTGERRGRSLGNLAEYFQGRWAGRLKPVSLRGPTLLLADRKVPPQPLWFAPRVANVRKLQELPHHLLHAGMWEELRQEVISNAEWLHCQIRLLGVSSAIQDLDQCCLYMDCTETRLIRDALVLIRPGLDAHVEESALFVELLARLSSLAAPYPSLIGRLCGQCEDLLLTCSEPVLIPKCSFLAAPGGALLDSLRGPRGALLCLDLSVEAELLVAGSQDGAVGVWSLAERELLHTLRGHTAAVLSVKIGGPAHCFSLAADGSLRRWSLVAGRQELCVEGAWPTEPRPSAVRLHVHGRRLLAHSRTQAAVVDLDAARTLPVAAGDEGSLVLGVLDDSLVLLLSPALVRIWTPDQSRTPETRLETSEALVTLAASVSLPARGRVVLASRGGFLYQICRSGSRGAARLPLVPSFLSASDDEELLLAGSDDILSLFTLDETSAHQFLRLQHHADVLSACLSADGRLLATGAADQLVRVWSVTTGALLDTLCGLDAAVTAVRWFGGLVLSASDSAPCVLVWSLKYDTRHKPAARIPTGAAHVAVARDADRVFFVQQQSDTAVVSWNSLSGSVSDFLPVSSSVTTLCVSQQRRLLLCGLSSGTVLLFPLDAPREALCIPPPESFSAVVLLAVGAGERRLAVAYGDAACLFKMAARDGFPAVEGPPERLPLEAPPVAMALLPGRRLLLGTDGGEVTLLDFGGGEARRLEPHGGGVTCVAGSTWGSHALVGGEDGVQRLWALDPLALDHTMECQAYDPLALDHSMECQGAVLCAAFSESDRLVFSASADGAVRVWDVGNGDLVLVQPVSSPVVQMVTWRNGFVGVTGRGAVIKETFRRPDSVRPDFDPLKNVKARCRVTSRRRSRDQNHESDLPDFNPAQMKLDLLSVKPSSACRLF